MVDFNVTNIPSLRNLKISYQMDIGQDSRLKCILSALWDICIKGINGAKKTSLESWFKLSEGGKFCITQNDRGQDELEIIITLACYTGDNAGKILRLKLIPQDNVIFYRVENPFDVNRAYIISMNSSMPAGDKGQMKNRSAQTDTGMKLFINKEYLQDYIDFPAYSERGMLFSERDVEVLRKQLTENTQSKI